jgi:hypothetical protein
MPDALPAKKPQGGLWDCSACLFHGSEERVPNCLSALHFLQYTRGPSTLSRTAFLVMTGTPGGVFPPGRWLRLLDTRNMGNG